MERHDHFLECAKAERIPKTLVEAFEVQGIGPSHCSLQQPRYPSIRNGLQILFDLFPFVVKVLGGKDDLPDDAPRPLVFGEHSLEPGALVGVLWRLEVLWGVSLGVVLVD